MFDLFCGFTPPVNPSANIPWFCRVSTVSVSTVTAKLTDFDERAGTVKLDQSMQPFVPS